MRATDEQLIETPDETTRKVVFDGKIMKVETCTVVQATGRRASREMVRHSGGSAIAAVDDQGRIAMVRQWRTPLSRVTEELPAGKRDPGETLLQTAVRELKEETGCTAEHIELMSTVYTTPGYSDEVLGVFLATGLTRGEDDPDEGEFLQVDWVPLKEAYAKCMRGELPDSKTLCGILMAYEKLMK